MTEAEGPAWVTYDQVIAIHSRQLRRFGGAPGLRDDGLLRSALERPANKWHYEHAGLPELGASYAFGLAKNHPFVDGNKRTAGMVMLTFLQLNGLEPIATEMDYYQVMMAVANGQLKKEQLADWLKTVTNGTPPEIV